LGGMSPEETTAPVAVGGVAEATGEGEVLEAGAGDVGAGGVVGWELPITKARTSRQRFVDNGGPVIERVRVWLIFWGTAWAARPAPNPSPATITNAVRQILDSPYLSKLHEYRKSIGYRYPSTNGVLAGTSTVASATGSGATQSPASPPAGFTDSDVTPLVTNLITAKFSPLHDPSDPNLLYMVITPADRTMMLNAARGEHYAADVLGWTAHIAWLRFGGSLDPLTAIISHELVEAVSDPENTAIVGLANTCGTRSGWCEIGDICEGKFVRMSSGVLVQSYWSDTDGACVVPTAYPRPYRPHPP
jgi:hypothetical protein